MQGNELRHLLRNHGGLHWKEEIKLVDVPNEKTDKEKINEVLTAP